MLKCKRGEEAGGSKAARKARRKSEIKMGEERKSIERARWGRGKVGRQRHGPGGAETPSAAGSPSPRARRSSCEAICAPR
jgi:hypothetical protein